MKIDELTYLQAKTSMNNKLIVEAYKKEGLRANVQNGFAKPDQKTSLKGLKVLVDARLTNDTVITKGSTVYIKEEELHTKPWAAKILESEAVGVPFIIVDLTNIEFVDPNLNEGAKIDATPISMADLPNLADRVYGKP